MMVTIGEKIKKIRLENGRSQEYIASVAGISQTGFSKIEKNLTRSVTIEIGMGIAKALGVSFYELFEIDLLPESFEKLKADNKMLLEKIVENERIISLQYDLIGFLKEKNAGLA